jgi:hypothetical protein
MTKKKARTRLKLFPEKKVSSITLPSKTEVLSCYEQQN